MGSIGLTTRVCVCVCVCVRTHRDVHTSVNLAIVSRIIQEVVADFGIFLTCGTDS